MVTGENDTGVEAVVAVSETRADECGSHTSVFSDPDGDGVFSRTLDLHVVTDGDHLRTHSFTFDAVGNVSGEEMQLQHGFGWPQNVTYDTVTVADAGGDQYGGLQQLRL